jgi:ferredoxin
MRTLKIKYHKEKCIGAFTCVASAPSFFINAGEKADLLESEEENGWQTRIVSCDDITAERIFEAAEMCPINIIFVEDVDSGKVADTEVKVTEECKEICAQYDDAKEFVLDEKGYFLIRILPDTSLIEVGFCGKRNTVEVKITGKKPLDIYQTILREKIIDRPDHAAYLGRELQKAYTALQLKKEYVQDDELSFS